MTSKSSDDHTFSPTREKVSGDQKSASIIFFDGVCNLCNASVQFVIKRDTKDVFRFAALQSKEAGKLLSFYKIAPKEKESVVLLENGKIYTRSTAALRIAKKLNKGWPFLYVFIVIPEFIRNSVYNCIAKNRYKWFGKQENCWVPTPELKNKFL